MRLEHVFDGEMWYVGEGAWVYGEHEALGYGSGRGRVSGRITGEIPEWSNVPRRREDGVWLPDVRGYIVTHDGARVLLSFTGATLPEPAPGVAREMVCSFSLRTDHPSYVWVNRVAGLLEARYEAGGGSMRFRAFSCLHDGVDALGPA